MTKDLRPSTRRVWDEWLGGYTYDKKKLAKCQCMGSTLCICGEGEKERENQRWALAEWKIRH